MTRAGADITALLKLNADGFKTGIETSIESVNKFMASFKEIGANSIEVTKGFQAVERAIESLKKSIVGLEASTKNIKQFKTLAQGMQTAATAAQRLTAVAQRGGMGIEALNSVVATFKAGMESATINVNGLASAIRAMGNVSVESSSKVNESMIQYSSSLNMPITQMEKLIGTTNTLSTSYSKVTTTLQSWKSLTDSVVNSTTQNLTTSANTTATSMTNVSTSVSNTTSTINTMVGSTDKLIGSLNSTDGSIKHIDAGVRLARESMILFQNTLKGLITDVHTFNNFEKTVNRLSSTINASKMTLVEYGKIFNGLGAKVNPLKMSLINLWETYERGITIMNTVTKTSQYLYGSQMERNRMSVMSLITGEQEYYTSIEQVTASLTRNSEAMRQNGAEKLRAMGYTGKLNIEEEKETATTEKNTQSHYRNANAMDRSSSSANKLSTATGRLGKALSSLRMIGTMVGSMLAYNFAHKLLVATGETIHAKSEMEGYFKMLHFGQSEIDDFNNALNDTVKQFQRVNKYSLGETISSIGVEFNLSTEEMKKAMRVTSMITSEYLRAGRNANEASLAVKDVLQGQFQRLSRETGVKGEQLKEAGWSGDTTDVLGLMEALEKVGMSRNWDVFASKANSLNDILTILQNRFGEWSAEMVNIVQPSIINAFNSIMDVGGMLSQSLGGIWEWLNGNGWEQSAVKIGMFLTAIIPLSEALLMYRTNLTLVEASQLSLTQSIGALIFGLKGQQVAEVGVRNSILAKILGVKAESLAVKGSSESIKEKIIALKTEAIQQKVNKAQEDLETLAIEKNTIATRINKLQKDLEIASTQGLITAKQKETIEEELNTAQKKLNAIATLEQTETNGGLIASLYLLGTEEALVAGETGALATAMGVLNGVISLSPIGWLIAGLTALAGAFYIATGGLDEHWDKMKQFNEAMDNSDELVKANQEHLENLGETLGTDSEIYQFTADSVESFTKKLGSSKAMVKAYDDAIATLGTDLSAIALQDTKNLGLSDEQYNQLLEYVPALDEGYNTYYRALQVINKQKEDFGKSDRTFVKNMEDRGADEKDILDKREQHMEHYNNFIKHSAEHNTSEDWWSGSWAGFLAWLDSIQIWLDYKTEDIAHWISDFNQQWAKLPEQLGEAWNNLWSNLPDIGKMWNDWVEDVKTSLQDTYNSLKEMWDNFWSFSWLSSDDGESGSSPVSKSINLSDLIKSIIDFTADFGWVWDEIISPFVNSVVDGLSNPIDSLGVTEVIDAIINVDSSSIWTWVDEHIINPLKTSIEDGIKNTPVLGDVATFLGFGEDAETEAQTKGQSVGTSFNTGIQTGLTGVDQIINDAMSGLGLDEITAQFTANSDTINTTASNTASSVSTNYQSMKNNQSNALSNMQSKNTSAFNDMYTKTHTSLTQMKDSTSNITVQMTDAWNTMKDNIVSSANKIKTDSQVHFNGLSDTIKGFYQKIQNPSSWAGSSSLRSHNPTSTSRRVGRTVFGKGYAGGMGSPSGSMSISSLKQKLCPNGDCGNLFDGFKNTDVVDVSSFLSLVGQGHGFGGWNFSQNHYNHIKTTSDKWDTGSPVIKLLGGIATSTKFKVGEFNNGTPKISFDEFKSMAEAIFSAIPYRFYYDSSWKGSWLGALQAGACNCYDGALALIAFANACGFSGSMAHGTWTDPDGTQYPHVWATINGMKMDTTGWQQRGSWSAGGQSSRGSPSPNPTMGNTTIIVNINEPVYGVDDLDSKISDSIDKGLQKHFNRSYSIGV